MDWWLLRRIETGSVAQLPNVIRMTFPGGAKSYESVSKSKSLVTIVKLWAIENSQISLSDGLKLNSLTCLEPGNSAKSERTSFGERFASKRRLMQPANGSFSLGLQRKQDMLERRLPLRRAVHSLQMTIPVALRVNPKHPTQSRASREYRLCRPGHLGPLLCSLGSPHIHYTLENELARNWKSLHPPFLMTDNNTNDSN